MKNKNLVSFVVGTLLLAFVILGVYRSKTVRKEQAPEPKPESVVIVNNSGGTIILSETITQFAADGPDGLVTVDIDQGIGQLPAGKYQIGSWRAERKDEQNNTWTLIGRQYSSGDPFEIAEGGRIQLPNVGEPIIAIVHGSKIGPKYHAFTQSLQGRLDESITLTRNGSRPGAPKLRIKNKDGTYDRTFAFQYG
ncbi:MAG: hypothetical protein JXM79_14790 [Sedimentisphaerales bacterium]|nr:hypothetical protein [Sedimentisphaerales bacterium]